MVTAIEICSLGHALHTLIAVVPSFKSSTLYGTVQEDQHPLTGQRAANFRLLANQ